MDFAMESDTREVAAPDFNGDGWLDAAMIDFSDDTVKVLINDQSWESPRSGRRVEPTITRYR
jgi:hypothetical protein